MATKMAVELSLTFRNSTGRPGRRSTSATGRNRNLRPITRPSSRRRRRVHSRSPEQRNGKRNAHFLTMCGIGVMQIPTRLVKPLRIRARKSSKLFGESNGRCIPAINRAAFQNRATASRPEQKPCDPPRMADKQRLFWKWEDEEDDGEG